MAVSFNKAFSAYTSKQFAAQNTKKNTETNGVNKAKTNQLSKKAELYLEKLKKQFKNVDFMVHDYANDEEAQQYLAKGKGEYNCVITPELLEEMASDDKVAKQYENTLKEGTSTLDSIKENAELNGFDDMIKKYGFSIDSSGKVDFYTILNQNAAKANNMDPSKPFMVKGDSVHSIIHQLNAAKGGDYVKPEEKNVTANKSKDGFDHSSYKNSAKMTSTSKRDKVDINTILSNQINLNQSRNGVSMGNRVYSKHNHK